MSDQVIEQLIGKINRLQSRVDHLERLEAVMGQYGYIDGAWQKQPLLLGYSGKIARGWSSTTLAAGSSNIQDTAVPAGEIWVITNIAVAYVGTVSGVRVQVEINSGFELFDLGSFATGIYQDKQGFWILEEGDQLTLAVSGATLNDDLYGKASGWRVDIDQ